MDGKIDCNSAIDLRSDTLSKASLALREIIKCASDGDACYEEDSDTKDLERFAAELLKKEDAIFTCSGTMSNQIALLSHCNPGDEVLIDASYHIAFFENAQSSALAGISLNMSETVDGIMDLDVFEERMKSRPRGPMYAKPRLLCLENTISTHCGSVFPFDKYQLVCQRAHEEGLSIHLDGARLFNACVSTKTGAGKWTEHADSVSICLSKGLGAPFGSVLAGDRHLIKRAKNIRKWLGGALHQSGFMAAAGLYCMKNNVERLQEDHDNAAYLAQLLSVSDVLVCDPKLVQTNMVHIDISKISASANKFNEACRKHGVLLFPWTEKIIRATVSMNNRNKDMPEAASRILRASEEF